MLLGFFRFGIFAFDVSERYVQRLVSEADSNGIHRDAFLLQRVGVCLTEAVKLPWQWNQRIIARLHGKLFSIFNTQVLDVVWQSRLHLLNDTDKEVVMKDIQGWINDRLHTLTGAPVLSHGAQG